MPATFALVFGSLLVASEAVASGRLQEASSLAALENAFDGKPVAYQSPIQRVVALLMEMKGQLEKEVAGDAELYDKMVCWCETNEKEKTKAIADADAALNELQADIESRAAREGHLGAKIADLKEELAEKKAALKKATAIREKERAEFYAEENEAVQAVTMLKNAIIILSKNYAGLIQMTPALEESMNSALRWTALKHEEMLEMNLEPSALRGHDSNRVSVASLLAVASSADQAKDAAFATFDGRLLSALDGSAHNPRADVPLEFGTRIIERAAKQAAALVQTGQPAPFQSYAPQSSQIFGILKQMKEDFEANLSTDQKEELKAAEVFEEFKAASIKAIDAGSAKLDEMEEEYAGNTKALSDAKEDFETTQAQRSADVKFLTDLKVKCQELDRDYANRTKARNEEIKAVSEAIAILTDDDSRSLFDKKLGGGAAGTPTFIQVKASNAAAMQARNRAYSALMTAARRFQQSPDFSDLFKVYRASDEKPSQQLAAIAVKVQLDAFTKVKAAIDTMVADLTSQQEKEVEKKANCTSELNENEKMTYTTEQELADLQDKIKGLEILIQKLTDEIAAAKVEIAETKVALKQAGEDRQKENQEFQEEVTDQRTMQAIIKKAIDRMKQVYGFLQQEQTPPVKFQPYKQNAGASPVIGLMEQIVGDSKKVESEAMAGEQEAQKAYAEFVVNANDMLNALTEAIQTKTDAIAQATLDKTEADTQEKSTEDRLQSLVEYNADLHADCDYTLKNFDIRQKACLQEIEALKNAKAFLDGMKDN